MEKEKKKKRKKVKVHDRKVTWWKKCKELIIRLSLMGMKKGQKKKEGKQAEGRTTARQVSEKLGKWLFLFLFVGQNWPSASAAAEGQQRWTGGGSDEDAAGSAGQRIQMDGRLHKGAGSEKRKTELKCRQKQECCGALWSMGRLEHREKVFEKIPRKMRYFSGLSTD